MNNFMTFRKSRCAEQLWYWPDATGDYVATLFVQALAGPPIRPPVTCFVCPPGCLLVVRTSNVLASSHMWGDEQMSPWIGATAAGPLKNISPATSASLPVHFYTLLAQSQRTDPSHKSRASNTSEHLRLDLVRFPSDCLASMPDEN